MEPEKIKTKEDGGMHGKIIIRRHKAGTIEKAQEFISLARKHADQPEIAKLYLKKAQDIFKKNEIGEPIEQKNLIMQSANHGKDILIQILASINTYTGNINYCEIGTGATTPTAADVALTTPTLRAPLSFAQDYGNVTAIVQFFMTDANLANGTYYEIGTFIDGAAVIGTGQLFNHALLGTPYVKTSGQDTTIEVDITLT